MEHYEKFVELGGRSLVDSTEYARIRNTVETWKKLKKASEKGGKNGRGPGPTRGKVEEEAMALYNKARSLAMKRNRTKKEEEAAFSMLQELLEKYGKTDIVKQKKTLIEVLLRRLQPKKDD